LSLDGKLDVATAPPEIDEIRRRMAQIRRDLHADVQHVVEGAEAATDWRRYIRNYPLATLGLALAVGYLVVPRRHRATTTIQVAPAEAIQAEAPRMVEAEKKKGKGIVGSLFGLVAPVALRAAQGYALQFFEQWMAQKMAQQLHDHPELAAAFGGSGTPPRGSQGPQGPQGPLGRPPGAPRF